MTGDSRVQELLDQLIDPQVTPEAACADCPELLPEVRARWQRMRRLSADLDTIFPSSDGSVAPGSEPELPNLPGHKVEAVLGQGGMGIVFQARDLRLNRPVAVKMILAGPYALPQERQRFVREAEAVAGLSHPNIVQVYEAGETGGRPYYTMELVEGGSLARLLAGKPLPPPRAAGLVAAVAEAVHEAHQRGIVHRDLTPANILLAGGGIPKVTDFGLARRLEGDQGLTMTGMPVGTPSYMSPCQARGDKNALSPATDTYALGAILYECLTGRPPFLAATAAATIQQVLAREPAPPSKLNHQVPRDLETICLKCLQKEPHRRYASAADLAADLDRFLNHEPIQARPVGLPGKLARWARRHPGTAVMTGLLAATALAAVALIVWQWRVAESARGTADRMATRLVLDRGIALCERGDIGPGLFWFARGLERAELSGDPDLVPAFRANLSAWFERLVVPRVSPSFGASVMAVAYHPDGKRLLVARWHDANREAGPGEARVLDSETWRPVGPPMQHPRGVRAAVFSPDGTRVLTGGADGSVQLWDTESGRPIREPLQLGAVVPALAFAPDGKTFATSTNRSATTGEARIWDAEMGQPVTPVLPHGGIVHCLAFSPDGRILMTGCHTAKTANRTDGGEARFWDSRTGLPAGPVLVHAAPVSAVAFSPDGQTVAIGSADGLLVRWRRGTWEPISPPLHHLAPVRAAAFSRDGRSLLTADGVGDRPKERESALRLWDLDSGHLLAGPWAQPLEVGSISRSLDGHRVATGCFDGHVRVYPLGGLQPTRHPYLGGIRAAPRYTPDGLIRISSGDVVAAFSPDGRHLLAGGETPDGREAAHLVDVLAGGFRDLLPERSAPLFDAVRAAGVAAVGVGGGGLSSLSAVPIDRTPETKIDGVTFGPGGTVAVTTSADGTTRFWDVGRAALVRGPRSYGTKTIPWMLQIPDDRTLVTGARGRPIEVWDRDTGHRVAGPVVGDAYVQVMTVSADGRTLATAGDGGIVQLWDVRTGQFRARFDAVNNTIWSLRFSPDGRTLLAGGERTAWLFDVATGKQRCQPLPQAATVWEARFSPDGNRLLTVCSDEYRHLHPGTVQLWDGRSGKPLGSPLRHPVAGLAAAFDPEGRLVATGGFYGDVRFWDAATGAPVGPALVQSGPIPAIAFVAGTKLLAAAGKDGNVALWPVPDAKSGSPAEVRGWVRRFTGQEFDETDAVPDLK